MQRLRDVEKAGEVTIYVGVDVGLDGAICAICERQPMLYPMPTLTIAAKRAGARNHRVMDAARVNGIFVELARTGHLFVMLETAQLRPAMMPSGHQCPRCGKDHLFPGQGLASQAEFIGQFREIRGILRGLAIPFDEVTPRAWKKDVFHGRSEKIDARILAATLFPSVADKMTLKKNDGLAEALLLADYARRHRSDPF